MSKKAKKQSLSIKACIPVIKHGLDVLSRYVALLLFLLISGVYGFVILRVNMLANAQPNQEEIDAQTTTSPIPPVDPRVAQQLQNMQDNSVNVKTLFDDARNNPFQ